MDRIRFRTSVQNKGVAEDIADAIRGGIRKSSGQTSSAGVSDQVEEAAQERIRETGAVWTGELVESFEVDYHRAGNRLVVTVENVSDHAAPIEYGAEYTDRGPPVASLIPWAATKMQGFTIPEDDRSDLPDASELDERLEEEGPDGDWVDILGAAPPHIIEKAFWLQQHIKEHGIDAVRYMEIAEQWASANADKTVAHYIGRETAKL